MAYIIQAGIDLNLNRKMAYTDDVIAGVDERDIQLNNNNNWGSKRIWHKLRGA